MTTALIATLVTHGACPDCQQPVNDQGQGSSRGWIHTETGQYHCPPGTADSWVGVPDPDAAEDALQTAVQEAAEAERLACEETMYYDDQMEDARDEARAEGRRAMHAEIDEAFDAAINAAGRPPTVEALLEALHAAWIQVTP